MINKNKKNDKWNKNKNIESKLYVFLRQTDKWKRLINVRRYIRKFVIRILGWVGMILCY